MVQWDSQDSLQHFENEQARLMEEFVTELLSIYTGETLPPTGRFFHTASFQATSSILHTNHQREGQSISKWDS